MTPDCIDVASQVMTNLRELTLGRGASCSAGGIHKEKNKEKKKKRKEITKGDVDERNIVFDKYRYCAGERYIHATA